MIPMKDFPIIIITISICMIGLTIAQGILISKAAFIFLFVILLVCLTGSSITMYFKLSSINKSYEQEMLNLVEKSKLPGDELTEMMHAISILNKYGVSYTVDLLTKEIHATLSMGMYTRMSVANNISPNVYYYITGTDVVLNKTNNDTNVQD